jgi:hypothetical protein
VNSKNSAEDNQSVYEMPVLAKGIARNTDQSTEHFPKASLYPAKNQ